MFGDRVLIFSNSAGSSDDDGFVKAREIEEQLDIAVLKHSTKVREHKHTVCYSTARAFDCTAVCLVGVS